MCVWKLMPVWPLYQKTSWLKKSSNSLRNERQSSNQILLSPNLSNSIKKKVETGNVSWIQPYSTGKKIKTNENHEK